MIVHGVVRRNPSIPSIRYYDRIIIMLLLLIRSYPSGVGINVFGVCCCCRRRDGSQDMTSTPTRYKSIIIHHHDAEYHHHTHDGYYPHDPSIE
jgi:hypothetical protein